MATYLKRPRLASDQHGLTYNERRVVGLLVEGRRQRDVAAELGTSIRSVRQMAHIAYGKLGVSGQVELMAKFRRLDAEAAE